eukprot:TRINITY_DN71211_c0_g1_i1.p1 TRINITY_DN71211_c0_g1~~TRINITY_DN71211_c0_g1_i1.p1  ORF type:complete len:188 (+),score=17.88 TRINITY_DN71211_c0_g1_i1:62-625(+)
MGNRYGKVAEPSALQGRLIRSVHVWNREGGWREHTTCMVTLKLHGGGEVVVYAGFGKSPQVWHSLAMVRDSSGYTIRSVPPLCRCIGATVTSSDTLLLLRKLAEANAKIDDQALARLKAYEKSYRPQVRDVLSIELVTVAEVHLCLWLHLRCKRFKDLSESTIRTVASFLQDRMWLDVHGLHYVYVR